MKPCFLSNGNIIRQCLNLNEGVTDTMLCYSRLDTSQIESLWKLQKSYKTECGCPLPGSHEKYCLKQAIANHMIIFYGVFSGGNLIGCCSVASFFSTSGYNMSGLVENFYLLPKYRNIGIEQNLIRYVYADSGINPLTIGSDGELAAIYRSSGFEDSMCNLLAFRA